MQQKEYVCVPVLQRPKSSTPWALASPLPCCRLSLSAASIAQPLSSPYSSWTGICHFGIEALVAALEATTQALLHMGSLEVSVERLPFLNQHLCSYGVVSVSSPVPGLKRPGMCAQVWAQEAFL